MYSTNMTEAMGAGKLIMHGFFICLAQYTEKRDIECMILLFSQSASEGAYCLEYRLISFCMLLCFCDCS